MKRKVFCVFLSFHSVAIEVSTLIDQFRFPGMSHSCVLAKSGELHLGLIVQWRQALKNNMAARAEAVSREGLFVSVSCPRSDTCAHSSLGTPPTGRELLLMFVPSCVGVSSSISYSDISIFICQSSEITRDSWFTKLFRSI